MKRLLIALTYLLLGTHGLAALASFQTIPLPGNIRTARVSPATDLWQNFFDILAGRRQALGENQVIVRVRDAKTQEPLANATVLLGTAVGSPFENNQAVTNADGTVVFTNAWFKDGKPFAITAAKEGFGTVTAFDTAANQVDLELEPHSGPNEFAFVEGKVYGWPPGYDKSTLEVGIFLPGISPASLLNFDPQQIVSSYKVEIDVYGKRLVPGNVVMPQQSKRYIFFPITIEKETFIMPLQKGTTGHMSAVVGAVPISEAISLMKEKDFLGLLNLTQLTHLDWSDRMTIDGNRRFDLNTRREIKKKLLTANYENVPAGLDVVAIAAVDPARDQGDLVAIDVKSLKSEDLKKGRGAIALGGLADQAPNSYVFSALFDRSQFDPNTKAKNTTRALTGRLQNVEGNRIAMNKMLQIIKPGSVSADRRTYTFSSPNSSSSGVNADLLLLNIYAEVPNAVTQGKIRQVVWTALLPANSTSVQLPNLGKPVLPNLGSLDLADGTEFSWEIIAVKSRSASQWKSEFDLNATIGGLEYVSSMAQKF